MCSGKMAVIQKTYDCHVCNSNGAKTICETCPRAYHLNCFSEDLGDRKTVIQQCYICTKYGSKAIQVVEFEKREDQRGKVQIIPKLHIQRIEQIIKDSNAEKLPVVIVSVAGVGRSGKSFLLSLFIDRNIHQLEGNNTGWPESHGQIAGFKWHKSDTAVTIGMWMWERAFITKLKDGTKVAIIYMDTQGTGDRIQSTDAEIDTLIMYLSLEISAIQIHNINQMWRVEDTKIYEVCKLYAERLTTGEHREKPFNSLVILYRNWQADREHGYRSKYLKIELQKVEKDPKAYATLKGIEASFDSVEFVMLPQPGEDVLFGDITIAKKDISKRFMSNAESFFELIFGPIGCFQGDMKSCKTGDVLIKVLKELDERLSRKDLPPIESAADHLVDSLNNQLYIRVITDFERNIIKVRNQHEEKFEDFHEKDLDRELNRLAEDVLKDFNQKVAKTNPSDQSYKFYLEKLQAELDKKKTEVKDFVIFIRLENKLTAEKLKNNIETEMKRLLVLWDERVKELEMNIEISTCQAKMKTISKDICKAFDEFMSKQASGSFMSSKDMCSEIAKKTSIFRFKQISGESHSSRKGELKEILKKKEKEKIHYFEVIKEKEKLEVLLQDYTKQRQEAEELKKQWESDTEAMQEEIKRGVEKGKKLESALLSVGQKMEDLYEKLEEAPARTKKRSCPIL